MAVVATKQSADQPGTVRPLIWHHTAPRRVVEKYGADEAAGWQAWQKHLARRKRPLVPPFLDGKTPAIFWCLPELAGDSSKKRVRIADFAQQAALAEASDENASSFAYAFDQLAAAYALPALAERLPAETWWALAERLRQLAIEADTMAIDRNGDPQQLLRQQVLAGELPLALGYLFPELQLLRSMRQPARNALAEALVEWTDGQGMPHGRLMPILGPLWACWTRCRWMGERLQSGCWSREAEVQYQWLVRDAIRLTDLDGAFMLSDHHEPAVAKRPIKNRWPKGLYQTALELVGDRADLAAAAAVLPKHVLPKRIRAHKRDLPDASLESEWSGVAVLATDWERSSARLALLYADEPMRLELSIGRERLLDGLWTSHTTCDGEPVRFRGEWEQACWQSDATCDFLELCAELSHGLRLERQLLLSRTDHVLYVADMVVATDGTTRRLTHAMELPIGTQVAWNAEAETRDGVLVAGKSRAAVLPLALSEWRSDPRGGRLDTSVGKLILTQETTGRALCCPLLIDLDRGRTKKERTWRQLTVAEALEAVPHDVAVGFRAQAGRKQWLFYRSLAPAGNRTVIGQNIAGEFYAGSLKSDGKVDEWIEIEACE